MIRKLREFSACEAGATAAEYVLILAIVGTSIAAAALLLGGSIDTQMTDTSTCISSSGQAC